MAKKSTTPKPRRVSYELIERGSVIGHPMYALLNRLVAAHHEDLTIARIALAWCTSWQPDADGRVTLGKCMKASDLHRELAPYDFVILLRRAFWCDDRVTAEQRTALLDHELCHAMRALDRQGLPASDERDRPVFRLRKHDIEEFTEIIERHGTYKADLEVFAAALRKSAIEVFRPCDNCRATPGWISGADGQGRPNVSRCACWITWSEQRAVRQSA